jgi:uroporphyrin-III C-methyltransferase/precorrin-2 dehydrogenase/sirohydrochlorin ferrochelatase
MSTTEPKLLPLFLKLAGKRVLMVGAGPVAASKLSSLIETGAEVVVVAPDIHPDIAASGVTIHQRPFEPSDLEGVWLVVAAALPEANAQVSREAEARRLFVNAVDDPPRASAYLGGVVRKAGMTLAISTDGAAPALAGLFREALDALLPDELAAWMGVAREQKVRWKEDGVPMEKRRPLLLKALNRLYDARGES